MLPNWLKAVASGLIVAAATLLSNTPAHAFERYLTRPVWMPPPNVPEIDIDRGFGNDDNWSVPSSLPPRGDYPYAVDTYRRAPLRGAYGRQIVAYSSPYPAGSIVVDTGHNFLYLVLRHGEALRYGVGTARPGFGWRGSYRITSKREWPGWTPPADGDFGPGFQQSLRDNLADAAPAAGHQGHFSTQVKQIFNVHTRLFSDINLARRPTFRGPGWPSRYAVPGRAVHRTCGSHQKAYSVRR